jgi:hypothetical protein
MAIAQALDMCRAVAPAQRGIGEACVACHLYEDTRAAAEAA